MTKRYQFPGFEADKVGVIHVDSGTAVIGDPCYVLKHSYEHLVGLDEVEMKPGTGWVKKGTDEPADERADIRSVPYGPGGAMVVVSSTGFGDGEYPVYAVRGKTRYGKRVLGLFVDFSQYADGSNPERFMDAIVQRDSVQSGRDDRQPRRKGSKL